MTDNFLHKSFAGLDNQQQALVTMALGALDTAYAPYSRFRVGAALMLDDGRTITGSNQENQAYPSGICAERAALFAFGSLAEPGEILKLAIVARRQQPDRAGTSSPCGACRQVMLEYELRQSRPFEVIFYHQGRYVVAPSARSLLPFHFHLLNSGNE